MIPWMYPDSAEAALPSLFKFASRAGGPGGSGSKTGMGPLRPDPTCRLRCDYHDLSLSAAGRRVRVFEQDSESAIRVFEQDSESAIRVFE